MRFWKKELPKTGLHLRTGQVYRFETYPDGNGYFATDDGFLNQEFSEFCKRRVGGIVEIDQATYEAAVKKNADMRRSDEVLKQQLQNLPPPLPKVSPLPDIVGAIVAGHTLSTGNSGMPKGLTPPPIGRWRPRIGPPPSNSE